MSLLLLLLLLLLLANGQTERGKRTARTVAAGRCADVSCVLYLVGAVDMLLLLLLSATTPKYMEGDSTAEDSIQATFEFGDDDDDRRRRPWVRAGRCGSKVLGWVCRSVLEVKAGVVGDGFDVDDVADCVCCELSRSMGRAGGG